MIRYGIDEQSWQRLRTVLNNAPKDIRKQLKIAVNATGQKTQLIMGRLIREEIAVKASDVKKAVVISAMASETELRAVFEVPKSKRLSLHLFGARQTGTGVMYRISKRGGRKTIRGAFQGPKPGVITSRWRGAVHIRNTKKRMPIRKLRGPSLWGVIAKDERAKTVAAESSQELLKQVERRIRFLELKQSGGLRGKQ